MTRRLIVGTLPLITGGLIYLTYRTDSLRMFAWFHQIGLSESIQFLRSNQTLQNPIFPNWIKLNLPDALWLFSFNYILLTLWEFNLNRQSLFWFAFASSIGLCSEVGQLLGIIPGTFDGLDLSLLLIATLLSITPAIHFKSIKLNPHE